MHSPTPDLDADLSDRLLALGWSEWFAARFAPTVPAARQPGRVVTDHGSAYIVSLAGGDLFATVTGRVKHRTTRAANLPVVGDWVIVFAPPLSERAVIEEVLERRTTLRRKVAGEVTEEQVIAANIDVVFIAAALTNDINLRRLERYVAVAWDSGATPVILFTKSDLAELPPLMAEGLAATAAGVTVLVSSAVSGEGIDLVRGFLPLGVTAVLIGPSGVGKSALINRLVGDDAIRTKSVRPDGKGRHTTTARHLVALPGGGLIIDTPGVRELQLWADEESVGRTFDDIATLALACRFSDCRHDREPGCAVRAAILADHLPSSRLAGYRKLQREVGALSARTDVRLQQEERRKWRAIQREVRGRIRP